MNEPLRIPEPEEFFEKTEWRPSQHNPNKDRMWGFRDGKWIETVFCRFKENG